MRRRPLEPAALLPGPRAGWIAAVVPAVAVLAIMTLRYRGTSTPGRLDRGADLLTETFAAGRRGPFHVLVGIGDPVPVVLIALVLGAVALRLGRRRLAFLAVAGPGATGLATIALKPVADRTIVNGGLAFPSGHTAAVTALGIVVALLVVAVRRSSSAAAAAWVAGGALAGGGGMGVALVAAEIHYATDAVGGFAVAVAVVLTVALVLDAAGGSRQRRSPAGITETVPRHGRRSGYPLNGTARRPGGAGTWRAR